MKQIVSAVPGRMRIKDNRFGEASAANDFVSRLQQAVGAGGGVATRINPQASCVVVRYDAGRVAPADMQRAAQGLLTAPAQPPRAKSHGKRRSRRLRINRYAKIGALTSLAASMAFAAAGSKRLHVVTGMVFLACLAAHLTVFRRTLVH